MATVLLSGAVAIVLLAPHSARAVVIRLYMPDDCRRCQRYAEYLRAHRFTVVVTGDAVPMTLRAEHRVPLNVRAMPIGFVDERFILGHVPAEDIRDLIAQPADALGLIVPGAPAGAPGIDDALPRQFTVYRVLPGGLLRPVDTYNHLFHFW